MKKILYQESSFFIVFFLFWISGILIYFNIYKGAEILWIQKHYFGLGNWLFTWLTLVVEIPVCVAIIFIVVLLFSYRKFIFLLLNYLLTGAILLLLKEHFQHPRPFVFFSEQNITLDYLPHINPLIFVSFPSGHSEAAIVFAFTINLLVKKHIYKILIALLGMLICFSRVYLMQHFLEDILAGSLLGLVMSVIWLYLYNISFGKKIAEYGLYYTSKKWAGK